MERIGIDFVPQVTLGSLLSIVTLISMAIGIGMRLGRFEQKIETLFRSVAAHAQRLDRHEERLIRIVEDVQRIIGRVEEHGRGDHDRSRRLL